MYVLDEDWRRFVSLHGVSADGVSPNMTSTLDTPYSMSQIRTPQDLKSPTLSGLRAFVTRVCITPVVPAVHANPGYASG